MNSPRAAHLAFRALLLASIFIITGCSMSDMVVKGSLTVMDGGVEAMNRESDLGLAQSAIPANLKMAEGLIIEAPDNVTLRIGAAQALYGYAFAFVEDEDRDRAAALYRRCLTHAGHALGRFGLDGDVITMTIPDVRTAVGNMSERATAALFWAGGCLAKWVDMSRDNPVAIAQLNKAEVIMQRVLELDETYYLGGAHLFFGAYYGGRSPMFGGSLQRSREHFDKAREISADRLLIVDYLQALTLDVQSQDQASFHARLTRVIEAPADLFPEQALSNEIARAKARTLLAREESLF